MIFYMQPVVCFSGSRVLHCCPPLDLASYVFSGLLPPLDLASYIFSGLLFVLWKLFAGLWAYCFQLVQERNCYSPIRNDRIEGLRS